MSYMVQGPAVNLLQHILSDAGDDLPAPDSMAFDAVPLIAPASAPPRF
jgi:hypothetical protein